MSEYEVLSVILSSLAALISLIVWNGQRKLQRESLDMQKATAELAKKQLEILLREDKEKSTARLKVDLVKSGNGYKFVITNISNVDAKNISFELLVDNPRNNPLVGSDVNSKLPAPKLSPGSELSLLAAIHLGSPTAYNALLTWTNPNGEAVSDETYVSL
ncbi:hypothetical protein [Photobacterium leiognathi]|uniref:hypothetical protein n=1 Tax=Photobacterium leiognathi TaxID=553611 RepID=UPI000D15C892|nr:hypothetical protein [Photobacterium leiognathi]PSW44385.1 hypothetical protein C0W40_09225 [Photobacterium leiognathi subsp. mandapamensis]